MLLFIFLIVVVVSVQVPSLVGYGCSIVCSRSHGVSWLVEDHQWRFNMHHTAKSTELGQIDWIRQIDGFVGVRSVVG